MNVPPFTYMQWAKERPSCRYDLATSEVLHVTENEFPEAREALRLASHPGYGRDDLRERIATHLGLGPEQILPVPGSSAANFVATAACLEAGDHAIVEHPTYPILTLLPGFFGATVDQFDRRFEDRFAIDPERVQQIARKGRTRLVILTNLHNPSGVSIPEKTLQALAAQAHRGGWRLLIDEVYRDFLDHPGASAAALDDRILTTGSLTKVYGLGGLRLGWVAGPADWIARCRRIVDYLHVVHAGPCESIGLAAFDLIERFSHRSRSIVQTNAPRLARFCESHPSLSWIPPAGGVVAFPRLAVPIDGLQEQLQSQDVAVAPGDFFGAPEHLRLGCGLLTPDLLDDALLRLGKVLQP